MRWLTHNIRLKALSVFLATSTWGVVAYAGNPPDNVTVKVNLEHAPLQDLVFLPEPPPVSVTVVGLSSSIRGFHKDSLHASVDVSTLHPGQDRLRVRVDNAGAGGFAAV